MRKHFFLAPCGGGSMAAKSSSTSTSNVQSAQPAGYPITIQGSSGNTMQATLATVLVN